MLPLKLLFVANEGLIFGIFALGLYIAFQWLKFPDLTPDGSFVVGPCVFVQLCHMQIPFLLAILGGVFSGFLLGSTTIILNKFLRIPSIISGLITSTASYSLALIILRKPNETITTKTEFFNSDIIYGQFFLFTTLILIVFVLIFLFQIVGNSTWGLRLRAIGENPLLCNDLKISEKKYYIIGLGAANSLVSFSGILFTQRSYTVDVNMGIGYTIIGLIAMILGLILSSKCYFEIWKTIVMIIVGAFIYKCIIQLTLEFGFPTDSFRLISALLIVALFYLMKRNDKDFMDKLRWS